MAKALLLFSGGLDSMLAAKILISQNIKITPVCFRSYFFGCVQARKSAEQLGLKLKVVDIGKVHLEVIKNPKYGLGKGMNPCVDCHLLMLKKAKEIMEKQKFGFIATGEVLRERPFSQNKRTFALMERELGMEGKILRPLSAKLLPETEMEKTRQVQREKLFAISGKSRKPQIALAKKFKIKKFPSPAGGCVLTDPEYSKRLKKLLENIHRADGPDCQVLRKGRIFWQDKFLIVVGRNETENKELKGLKKAGDVILVPENFPGPSVLIKGFGKKAKKDIIKKAKELLLFYSKKLPQDIKIGLKEQKEQKEQKE